MLGLLQGEGLDAGLNMDKHSVSPSPAYLQSMLGCCLAVILTVLTCTDAHSAEATDAQAAAEPVPISVGIQLHQIVAIDQVKESFTAVISIKAAWQDDRLASDADDADLLTLNLNEFRSLVKEKGSRFPSVVVYNQQGMHQIINSLVTVAPDGNVSYLEYTTLTLQATNFDFRKFPFDQQQFEIHLDSLFPNDEYEFTTLDGYSGVGNNLGEEEWQITGFETQTSSSSAATGFPVSRFSLTFTAKRHILYYITKIFIPTTVIIIVSWLTFFLEDYTKRTDLAGRNLLLLIAFNFTISNQLPRPRLHDTYGCLFGINIHHYQPCHPHQRQTEAHGQPRQR